MNVQELYITSAHKLFSTFLESLDLNLELKKQAELLFLSVLKNIQSSAAHNVVDTQIHDIACSLGVSAESVPIVRQFVQKFSLSQTEILLATYLLALKDNDCSYATIKNYRSDINQFLHFTNYLELSKTLTKQKVLEFIRLQRASKLSGATIKRKIVSLAQFGVWLESTGVVRPAMFSWLVALSHDSQDSDAQIQSAEEKEQSIPKKRLRLSLAGFTSAFGAKKDKHTTNKSQEYSEQIKRNLRSLQAGIQKKTDPVISRYANLAMMLLFLISFSYFGYQQFILNPEKPLAFPTTLTRPTRTLSFQGRLTDTAQNPIVSATSFRFKLYDSGPGIGSGTQLWDSGTCSITPDQDGIFAAGLGSDCGTEIASSVFSENANVWLQVQVGAETLTPRQSIKSVAYALNSETLQGFPPADPATPNTVVVMNNSGEVVLGGATPKLKASSTSLTLEGTSLLLQTASGSNGNIVLDPDGLGIIVAKDYIAAPGATLSATYAGGTALTLNAGPSATADIMQWKTSAGSTLGIISSSGNIGIGTTSTRAALDIAGDASTSGSFVFRTGTSAIDVLNGQRLDFNTSVGGDAGLAPKMTLLNNGNIGIGTTAPTQKLEIVGGNILLADTSSKLYFDNGSTYLSRDAANLQIYTDGGVNLTGSQYIFNTGNVGIGTTNPTQSLHVQNGMRLNGAFYDSLNSAGLNNYVLKSTGTATQWVDGNTLFDIGWWDNTQNALHPRAEFAGVADFLLGSNATRSAKFAVMNINAGTPTATISGNLTIAAPLGSNPATTYTALNGGTIDFKTSVGGDTGAASRLFIQNNGNINIGATNNPAGKLQIITGNGDGINFDYNLNSYRNSILNSFSAGNPPGNTMTFGVSTGTGYTQQTVMTLLGNGNVGIGTTTPTALLNVAGTASMSGVVTVGDNSASTIRPAAGANMTFQYKSGLDSWANAMTVQNGSGNIGIGTVSPLSGLHVSNLGQSGAPNLANAPTTGLILGQEGTNAIIQLDINGGSPAWLQARQKTAGASALDFLIQPSGGNVGIGTTAPTALLNVAGTASMSGVVTIGDNSASTIRPAAGANMTFQYKNGLNSWANAMTVQNGSGNIGIGTVSPQTTFEITRLGNNTNSVANASLLLQGTGAAAYRWGQRLDTSGNLNFDTNWSAADVTRLTLQRDGNIGIGTTAPTALLNVAGTASMSGVITVGDNSAATIRPAAGANMTFQYKSGLNSWADSLTIQNGTGNVGIGAVPAPTQMLDVNGSLRIRGNNITDSADATRINLGATTTLTNTTTTLSGTTTLTAASLNSFTTAAGLAMNSTTTLTLGDNAMVNGSDIANGSISIQGTSHATRTSSYVLLQPTAGNVGIGTTAAASFKLQVAGNVGPQTNATYDLGSNALRWNNIYGTTIYQGSNQVCDMSGNCSAIGNFWKYLNGAISPSSPYTNNSDILFGGDSTPSAKFAFMNIFAGTPTASISGNLAIAVPTGANPATTYTAFKGGSINFRTSVGGDAGATSRVFIANDGNVGVGTTSPVQKFQIGDNSAASLGLRIAATGVNWDQTTDASGNLNIANGNGNYLTFMRSTVVSSFTGSVGVGTTAPRAKLDIIGDASASGSLVLRGSNPATIDILNGNRLDFQTSPGGDALLASRMSLTGNGNLGIGTTTPTEMLNVAGNANIDGVIRSRVTADAANNARGISITPAVFGSTQYIRGYNNSGGGLNIVGNSTGTGNDVVGMFLDPGNGLITFGTNTGGATNIEQMRIAGSGNISIGTTTTSNGKLQVAGDTYIASSGFTFNNPSADEDLYVRGNIESDTSIYGNTIYQNGNQVCDASGNCSNAGMWQNNQQAIYPRNEYAQVVDVLVGGNSTASADFRVTGQGNGTTDLAGYTYGRRFLDIDDTNYYVEPGNTGIAGMFAGSVGIGATPTQQLTITGSFLANSSSSRIAVGSAGYLSRMGVYSSPTFSDSAASIYGFNSQATVSNNNSSYTGYYGSLAIGAGALIDTAYGMRISDPSGSGSVTTNYGLYIDSLTKGTTDYAIYSAGSSTPSYFAGNIGMGTTSINNRIELADHTTAPGGIGFGSDVDVYRSAADVLSIGGSDNFAVNGTVVITSNRFVQTGNGAAGGPSHTFSGDATTGMFSPSAGNLAFSTGGSEQVRVDSNGNVGINTTNPSSFKLQVNGNVGPQTNATFDLGSNSLRWNNIYGTTLYQNGNQVCDTSGECTTNGLWERNDNIINPRNEWASVVDMVVGGNSTASADFRVTGQGNGTTNLAGYTYGRRFLDIDDTNYYVEPGNTTTAGLFAGNVGIGTTTTSNARTTIESTATQLRLNNTAAIYTNVFTDASGYLNLNSTGNRISLDSGTYYLAENSAASNLHSLILNRSSGSSYTSPDIYGASGGLVIGGLSAGGGTIALNTTGTSTPTMYLSGSSVGIGTTGPSEKFHIYGAGSSIQVQNTTGNSSLKFQTGLVRLESDGSSLMTFTNGVERMKIYNTGNIAIGGFVSAPNFNLEIDGSIGPHVTASYDLGSPTLRWNNIYGTTIYQGANQVCDMSGNCSAIGNFWKYLNGAISPASPYTNNSDILLGGDSTPSAKFAFMNMMAGTPTASISGNLAIAVPTGANPATTYTAFNGGSINVKTSPGGDAGATSKLFIANNGNIGIGTTNPGSLASIYGNSQALTIGDGTNTTVYSSYAGNRVYFGYDGGNAVVQGGTSKGIKFNVNNPTFGSGTAMTLTSSGNLGVGSTSPIAKLDVIGDGRFTGYLSAPGATVSATYAGGKALVVRGGPSGTANIAEFQDSTGSPLTVINRYGHIDLADTAEPTTFNTILRFNDNVVGTTEVAGGFGNGVIAVGGENRTLVNFISNSAPNSLFSGGVNGEAYRRFAISGGGTWQVGSGTSSPDSILARLSSGGLYTQGPANQPQFSIVGPNAQTGNYLNITSDAGTAGNILTILSSGNLGIGTTTPTSQFQVNETTTATAVRVAEFTQTTFASSTANEAKVLFGLTNNENESAMISASRRVAGSTGFSIYTGNAGSSYEALHIKGSGSVGIGVNTPTDTLDVNGTLRIRTYGASTTDPVCKDVNGVLTSCAGGYVLGAGSGIANYLARWTDANTIGTGATYDNGTNVGIGTTSPDKKLSFTNNYFGVVTDSGSNYGITSNAYWNGSAYKVSTGGYAANASLLSMNGNGLSYSQFDGTAAGDTITWATRLTINDNGNVGIGTSAPLGVIDVNGALGAASWSYFRGNLNGTANPAATNNYGLMIGWNASAGSGETQILYGTGSGGGPRLDFGRWDGATKTIDMTLKGGNVGIGTTNPLYKLHVRTSANRNIVVRNASDFYTSFFSGVTLQSIDDANTAYQGLGLEASTLTINTISGGSVGIGTSSPDKILSFANNYFGVARDNNFNFALTSNAYYDGTNWKTSSTGYRSDASFLWMNGDSLTYSQYDGTSAGETITPVTRLSIDSAGNVGIGASTPYAKLHISESGADWNETIPGTTTGAIHLSPSNVTNYGNAITWGARDQAAGTNAQAGIYVRSNGSYGTKMYFATTGNYAGGAYTRMMLDYNGNVGIGTTTPGMKLDVVGGVGGDGIRIQSTNTAATSAYSIIRFLDAANNNWSRIHHFNADYSSNGAWQAGALAIANSSTGINLAADGTSGTIKLYTGGQNERMRIDANGNVGINSTEPIGKLDVVGGAVRSGTHATSPSLYVTGAMSSGSTGPATGNIEFRHDNGTQGIGFGYATIYAAGSNTNQDLNFLSKGTNPITLNAYGYSTGNVGIGTTTPYEKLEVAGAISATGGWSGNTSQGPALSLGYTSDTGQIQAVDWGVAYKNLSLEPGGGNVGIGITAPATRLQILAPSETYTFPNPGSSARGALQIRSNVNNTDTGITFTSSGSDNAQAGLYVHQDGTDGTDMYLATTNNYATGPQARLTILNNGYVGIGTTVPGVKLDVVGAIKTSRLGHYGTYNSAEVQGIWSISESYPISTGSNNFGTQYGIGYAYSTTGGAPFTTTHQIVFTAGGTIGASIGLNGKAYFAGSVGIGTSSPAALLEVAGDYKLNGPSGVLEQSALIGSSDNCSGVTGGRWIKVGDVSLVGAWVEGAGISIETYPRTDYIDGKQTVTFSVRNNGTDMYIPTVTLTTDNSGTQQVLIKDVKAVRKTGSSGVNNTVALWLQLQGDWACGGAEPAKVQYFGTWTAGPYLTPQPSAASITDTGTQYGLSSNAFAIGKADAIYGQMQITRQASEELNGFSIRNLQPGGYGSSLRAFSSQNFGSNTELEAGRIQIQGESNWGSAAATDSYMHFDLIQNGTIAEKVRITSSGSIRINRGQDIGAYVAGHTNFGSVDTFFGNSIGGTKTGMTVNTTWDGTYDDETLSFSTHDGGVSTGVRMFIDKSGYVGIGTATPGEKLEVNTGNIFSNGEGYGLIVDSGGNKRVGFMKYGGLEGSLVHGNATILRMGQVNQASVTGGTFTTQMIIDTAGNVGIGNLTTASTSLKVQGTSKTFQVSSGTTTQVGLYFSNGDNDLYVGGDSSQNGDIYVKNSAGNSVVRLNTTTQGQMAIYSTGGTEHLQLTTDGTNGKIRTNFYTNNNIGLCHVADGALRLVVDCSSAPTDLAELFATDDSSIEAGDLVSATGEAYEVPEPNTPGKVTTKAFIKKTTSAYEKEMIGIISTDPNQLYGDDGVFDVSENPKPVSMAGRVPTKVTASNGDIKTGDRLTASDIPGVAMKATQAGWTVAIALDNFSGPGVGKIISFIKPVWYDPNMMNVDTDGQIVINGSTTTGYTITATNTNTVLTNIVSAGQFLAAKIQAGLISTKDLVVEQTAHIASLSVNSLTVAGQNIQDYITQVVDNRLAEGSPIVSTSLIATDSANLTTLSTEIATVTDTLATQTLTVAGSLQATGSSQLGNILAESATLSGSLTAESASISGDLVAQDLVVTGSTRLAQIEAQQALLEGVKATTAELFDATISGTLYAENIADLDAKIATAIQQQPTIIDLLTGNTPTPPPAANPLSVYDPTIAAGYTPVNPTFFAEHEGISLVSGDTLIDSSAVFVRKYLEVNGIAYVTKALGIGETLTVGAGTTISDGIIAYAGTSAATTKLQIQPNGVGSVEILAGLIKLENGVATINGDLKVAGKTTTNTLLTNLIQPADFGNPFQVQVAGVSTESGQVRKSRFEIINELGTPVATISAEGKANFAGGIGVGSESLSVPSVASGSTVTVSSQKTSGKAKIPTGVNEITIESESITEDSLIYVTPVGSTQNQVLYVKTQTAENSGTPEKEGKFVVGFDAAVNGDVNFNWWIVN